MLEKLLKNIFSGNHISSSNETLPGKGKQVFIVEDDRVIIDLLRQIMRTLGFDVMVAKNAKEALDCFENNSKALDCVILDYGIPGMKPLQLVSKMRELNSDVKVLLSSGYSSSFISRDFPMEQVDGFIAKPYEPLNLVKAVMELVGDGKG